MISLLLSLCLMIAPSTNTVSEEIYVWSIVGKNNKKEVWFGTNNLTSPKIEEVYLYFPGKGSFSINRSRIEQHWENSVSTRYVSLKLFEVDRSFKLEADAKIKFNDPSVQSFKFFRANLQ